MQTIRHATLLLVLAAGACASTQDTQPWVDPSTATLARAGMPKISADKLEWTSFWLPTGNEKVYVIDVETSVPIAGFDYSMRDGDGKPIADSRSDAVHRIAVESNGAWAANAQVAPGWQSGSVSTSVIQPGTFRVYVEASSKLNSIQFKLKFKRA